MNDKLPSIRFKEFTDDWEQRKFGDLADYKKGPFGSAITKDMFVPKSEESIKVYEQQNAINKDWELERYFLPKEYALTKLKSFEVHGGDIIVSCAGTIGEIYEIPENADTGVINQALMRVRVDEDCVDKRMFKIAFSTMIDDFTRAHSNGSAIKNIPPFADLKPMGVLLPSLQEQEKISSYFKKLDNLITLHQRKYDHLLNIKKSMLEKMFPKNGKKAPEIRFDGFTDDWEQCKFSDVIDIGSGMDYKHLGEGNIPVYGTGGYMLSVNKALSYDKDAIGIGRKGTIDKPYILRAPFWTVDTLFYCIPKEHNNLDFINCIFQNVDWKKKDESTGVPSLSKVIINNVETAIPTFDEQQKIGAYFSELNNLITLHQRKLEKLQNLKISMLKQMFL